MNISFIGAGNVAWHLAQALEKTGSHQVHEVYSRSLPHAKALADKLYAAKAVKEMDFSATKANIVFICVPDDAIATVAAQLKLPHQTIVVHTAGNRTIADLAAISVAAKGVFYPLQTFSKNKKMDFTTVPICIEANNAATEKILQDLAFSICDNVAFVNANDRKLLHLSAVFACNFTNHLWVIAQQLLQKEGLDFSILHPLIKETMEKALQNSPENVQTGPAIRGDNGVIQNHLTMLNSHKAWKDIYKKITDDIVSFHRL